MNSLSRFKTWPIPNGVRAEHVFESRTPNELAAGQPGQIGAHFTPGDPFTVKAGITIHLW